MTSVLGHGADTTWLEDWRRRVGDKRADEISERSRVRGTRMHAALEASLRGEDTWKAAEEDAEAIMMAKAIAEDLFPMIREVNVSEGAVWSTRLKIAGRTDCAALMRDGRRAIVDFKNARHKKTKDDIGGYFLQSTLYAMLLGERTGVHYPYAIICVAYGDDMVGQRDFFHIRTADYVDEALRLVKAFNATR